MRSITLKVNGREHTFCAEDNEVLVDTLRDRLRLTGTKKGCGTGECGSCTVLLDEEPVNSCLVLTVRVDGRSIRTIEGVADGDGLHPLQRKFMEKGAFQCGFCTPGMVLSSIALLKHDQKPNEKDIRKGLAGNLCRCTGYANIVKAIMEYAEEEQ
jgi:aerobic-type carbon monoxide dehydrogenase small subunit (CoxS/CutS family)